jgi:hypothetical protein
LLAGLSLAACAPLAVDYPAAPIPFGSAIVVDAQPVPLDPTNPTHDRIGNFIYAGGVMLTSKQTSRLHGMSDLRVWPGGRLLAQSDQSDQLEARIVLDSAGRLVGLSDARISALKDEKGVDLYAGGQKEFDSEGIAEFANGDRIVAFEQHDRILLYPKGGGLPRAAPYPQIAYVSNLGIEALVADPSVAPDAYRVGIEISGQTYLCRLSAGCIRTADIDLEGLALSAMELLPQGRAAYLLRSYSPAAGNVMHLQIVDRNGGIVDELKMARPLTMDNFEGVAATPGHSGGVRLYLISDDNFGVYAGLPTNQRTLLLAFDWTPPRGSKP